MSLEYEGIVKRGLWGGGIEIFFASFRRTSTTLIIMDSVELLYSRTPKVTILIVSEVVLQKLLQAALSLGNVTGYLFIKRNCL